MTDERRVDPSDVSPANASNGADAPGGAALVVALAAASVAFGATFRGPRERFWQRMTITGLGLGSLALLTSAPARRARLRWWHVPLGLLSAAVLYVTFQLGDRFARRFVPTGDREIREIYALRSLGPREAIAARLATIIGPAEELFWRGLVQTALARRYGPWPAAVLATMAYGSVHIASGNFTLTGAAGVAGAHWSILYAAGVPLGALIVSHVAWDVWIFLVQPTGEVELVAAAPPR
jgi:membrane protease YdiL (CAAX protease family)